LVHGGTCKPDIHWSGVDPGHSQAQHSGHPGVHRLASDRKIANAKKIANANKIANAKKIAKANTPYVEKLKIEMERAVAALVQASTGSMKTCRKQPLKRAKMMDKSTSKIASKTKRATSHFSKAGIEQTTIWSVNFPKHSKPGPIPKKPNETGNFRGGHQPKRGQ
jgi:hypothetical protein